MTGKSFPAHPYAIIAFPTFSPSPSFTSYRLLARTQIENTTAVRISIDQATIAQLHRIKAKPAMVTGAIAAAATAARCRRVNLHRGEKRDSTKRSLQSL